MRRKRNRIFKRLVLGFAVAALVVPSTAVAARGGTTEQQGSSVKAGHHGTVRPMPSDSAKAALAGNISNEGSSVKTRDYFAHHALPSNYADSAVSIESARLNPRGSSSAVTGDIENVRLQPRTVSTPEVVSAGFDWGDAGVGAGILLGLILVGGAAFYASRQVGKPQTA